MSIEDTISVTTVVRDSSPAASSFGTMACIAYHEAYVGVETYLASGAGLAAMVAAGFDIDSEPYKVVAAAASQEVHVPSVKVFSRAAPNAQSYELTPTLLTVGRTVSFSLTYDGATDDVSYVVQTDDTAADIVTGLTASLGVVTGLTIGGTDTLTITLTTPGELRFYTKSVVGLDVEDTSADAGIAADLAAAVALDPDFYGFVIDSTSAAEQAIAAAWAASNKRILATASPNDENTTASIGIGYDLQQLSNYYTYVLASRDTLGHGHAGLMARQFSRDPGSSNWAHQVIIGQVADAWTQGEQDNLHDNGCMAYVSDLGLSHTLDGASCGGRFLDIVRGIDWLDYQIKALLLQIQINAEVIRYTDAGVARYETGLRSALGAAEEAGLLAPGWKVSVGLVTDQSALNKAARHFPDLVWNGVLQGASNSVAISGTVVL